MSNRRTSQNSQRHNHKTRRDFSPVNKNKDKNEPKRNKSDHDRFKSETDLSKQDDGDKEKEKDSRRQKDRTNVNKSKSRARSPRRTKDPYDRKVNNQKRDVKIKNDTKDKGKEKKTLETTGMSSTLFMILHAFTSFCMHPNT